MSLNVNGIPQALRERPNWVVWRTETRDGKPTKVPCVPMGRGHASVDNPRTWTDFDTAHAAYRSTRGRAAYDGIGYVFSESDPFCGIDLDRAYGADGELLPEALLILGRFDSYSEVTPSGKGLHIIIEAALPPDARHRRAVGDSGMAVEIYDRLRFFTVTGNALPLSQDIAARQEQLDIWYAELFPIAPERAAAAATPAPVSLDDTDLLERMFASEHGNGIRALYQGDVSAHGGDRSRADLALCNHLAFWCGGDAERMDRLFRASGLMRPKWDELRGGRTYGARTVERALADATEFYEAPVPTVAVTVGDNTVRPRARSRQSGSGAPSTPGGDEDDDGESISERRRRLKKERRDARSAAAIEADDLPVIEVNQRHLRAKAADALEALLDANTPPVVFNRGGALVRVGLDEDARPAIRPLTPAALRGRLARVANFVSTSEDRGTVPVSPPADVVEDLLALPAWPDVPPLTGIVTAPVVSADGVLSTTPGYLPAARLYYQEPDPRPLGDTTPTPEGVAAAKALLLDTLLADFPFVDRAGKAHALALLLLPFVRPCIAGATPLHLVDAPTPGSGKGLLVDVLTGVFVPPGAIPIAADVRDDDEWRKRITSGLASGTSHLFFDNINKRVDSGSLAAAITAREWRDRLLGGNAETVLPVRAVWVGTGNNTQLSDEITRRTIWIRLDPQVERPWDRVGFKTPDLRRFATEERPALLTAALTLVRAWLAAGRPDWSGRPLGSFEGWSRVLGGILEVCGVDGFLENRDSLFEKLDPERAKWAAFLAAWHEKYRDARCGVADVYELAVEADLLDGNEQRQRGEKNVLGRLLRTHEARVVAGYRLASAGELHRATQYVCERVGDAPELTLTPPPAGTAPCESVNQCESIPPRTRNVPIFHTNGKHAVHEKNKTIPARVEIDSHSFTHSHSSSPPPTTQKEEKKEKGEGVGVWEV